MRHANSGPRVFLPAALFGAAVLSGCGSAASSEAAHLRNGQAFLAAGNYAKARIEFRDALQIAPNDSNARFENGVAEENLGNAREAAQFYQGAIDINADNVRARAALGRLFLLTGAPARALETIKLGLVKHPNDAGLLTVRAAARLRLKDQSGALQDAERAVQLDPANQDGIAVLAGIYQAQGQGDKAEAVLQSGIKRIPNTVDLRLALAQLYAVKGERDKAEALLIDLVRLQPNVAANRLRLAQFYARLNQDEAAEEVLRDGIKSLPQDRQLKVSLVEFLAARRGRDTAEKQLKEFIAAAPKDYDLIFALASFYEQGKDFAKAEAVYRQVIAAEGLKPPGLTARNHLAELLVQQNDVPAAKKLIAEVLAKDPGNNDGLILQGNLALADKDPQTAIADLRAVLRDQPNAVGVMRTLARAHLANGEPELAERTMRRAVAANPTDPGAQLDLALLLVQLGKPAEARPVIDELVKQHPDDMQALDMQFKVAAANKDAVAAKAAADAMVATQPKQALGYQYQAAVAESQKRYDEAINLYDKALDLAPQAPQPLQGVTRVLIAAHRVPEALKRLDGVIAAYPKLPFAANLKGEVLLNSKRTAQAIAAFQMAIARAPQWLLAYHDLALAQWVGNHDSAAAIATLQTGIAKVSMPAALVTDLAELDVRLGKPQDAEQAYEAALRRDPQGDVLANNLAMLLVTYQTDKASLDRAKALAARFATSNNPAFLDTYGWVLYKRGETSAAIGVLQSVLSKNPEAAVTLYHLGMAQAAAGQTALARDNLARALRESAHFEGAAKAKAALDKLAKPAPVAAPRPKS